MPCKHEDLSSDLQNSGKLDSVAYICYSTPLAAVTARSTQQGMTMRSWISSNTQYCFLVSTCMLWLRQACSSSLWCCLMVFYPLYIFLLSWRIKLLRCFLFLPTSFVVTSAVFPSSAPGIDRVSLLLPCLAKATPSSSMEVSSGDFKFTWTQTPCLTPVLSPFTPRLELLPPLISQSHPERSRQCLPKFLLIFAFSQLHMIWKYS